MFLGNAASQLSYIPVPSLSLVGIRLWTKCDQFFWALIFLILKKTNPQLFLELLNSNIWLKKQIF